MEGKELREARKKFIYLAIFGIAMGLWEAITVVYLRKVAVLGGLDSAVPHLFAVIERTREAATIVILLAVAVIAGRNFSQRFAYFLFAFGVWDIFYYAGLKLFLDWPPSLLTQDTLFYLPVTWRAPVLAPVLCSLIFVGLALGVVFREKENHSSKTNLFRYGILTTGFLFILFTFIDDSTSLISSYNWPIFGLGAALAAMATFLFWKKGEKNT